MAQVITDGLLICGDCVQAIANADYTGLDYHYSTEESEARENQIRAGITAMAGYPVVGDERGFAWRGCDCCGSELGGSKWECTVLSV